VVGAVKVAAAPRRVRSPWFVMGGGGGGGGNNETRALESQLVVTGQEALEDATASSLSIAAGD